MKLERREPTSTFRSLCDCLSSHIREVAKAAGICVADMRPLPLGLALKPLPKGMRKEHDAALRPPLGSVETLRTGVLRQCRVQ